VFALLYGLMFGFTASLTLWQDLPPIQVIVVMVVLFGAALVALGGANESLQLHSGRPLLSRQQ